MKQRIDQINKRIKFLKEELAMRGYLNGWQVIDYEKELGELESELQRLEGNGQ
jgi:hypothetical protein